MSKYNAPDRGQKFDTDKDRFDLLPFDLMGGEQRVWEFGAKKYSANNWRKGMPMTQGLNAALRHITAYMMGEDHDPESKESHLDHAICCLRMAQNTARYYPQLDDRNRWQVSEPVADEDVHRGPFATLISQDEWDKFRSSN